MDHMSCVIRKMAHFDTLKEMFPKQCSPLDDQAVSLRSRSQNVFTQSTSLS